MIKGKYIIFVVMILTLLGCNSNEKNNNVEMKEINYLIPDGVEFSRPKDSNAYIISVNGTDEVAGFLQEVGFSNQSTKNLSVLKSAKILQKNMDTAYNNLQNDNTIINNVSLLSSQSIQLPYAYTIAHYQVRTYNDMHPKKLATELIGIITNNALENKPKINEKEITARNFRVVVIYGDLDGSRYYLVTVVPENVYEAHENKISEIMNGARVSQRGIKIHTKSEKFVVKTSNKKVDFLFVVDDSGSMSDNQQALSRAALDFTKEMSISGLSYRSAIITTGSGIGNINGEANRILREVGIIENNDALLQSKLIAGSNGSNTETGIWNAEQSLTSNGTVTDLGMPKKDTSMSVIIISDEESQYTSRANKSFNTSNNLFVNRNIKVYTIIDTSRNKDSQYDDLSMATSAMFADINNRDLSGRLNFTTIMKQIAQDAGGLSSLIKLEFPAANINQVEVDGKNIPYDSVNGYTYIQASQSIVFHGIEFNEDKENINIKVKYKYYK